MWRILEGRRLLEGALISIWIPKGVTLIWGQALTILEEIRYYRLLKFSDEYMCFDNSKRMTKAKINKIKRQPVFLQYFQFTSLREKCPNTEFFLVRIWSLFTQCISSCTLSLLQKVMYRILRLLFSLLFWSETVFEIGQSKLSIYLFY